MDYAIGEIVAVARVEPHALGVAPRHDTEAVVPAVARRLIDGLSVPRGQHVPAVVASAYENEVAAITRRLVEMILPADHFSQIQEKWLFDNVKGFDAARGKLLARLYDPDSTL